jgi:hypothetical protein
MQIAPASGFLIVENVISRRLQEHLPFCVPLFGNTIGSIVEGLTGRATPLCDIQDSDLFIVTVPPSGPAKLIQAESGTGTAGNSMMK